MINMVLVQNFLVPFCCVLGKDTLQALSPAWWSWQAVLNYSHILIKLQVNSNILACMEAGQLNAYPMY